MLSIEVFGRMPQGLSKDDLTTYSYTALSHFAKDLVMLDEMQTKNQEIDIYFMHHLVDEMSGVYDRIEDQGQCWGTPEHIIITVSRNEWSETTQQWQPFSNESILETLSHELVHAKQLILKQMFDRANDNRWREDLDSEYVDCANLPYEELPWEIEALRYEKKLVDLYWRNPPILDRGQLDLDIP